MLQRRILQLLMQCSKTQRVQKSRQCGRKFFQTLKKYLIVRQQKRQQAQKSRQKQKKKKKTVYDTLSSSLSVIEGKEKALGDSYDSSSDKANAYLTAINSLLTAGIDPTNESIVEWAKNYKDLTGKTADLTTTTSTFTSSLTTTTSNIDLYRQSIIDLFSNLNNIMALEKEYGNQYDANSERIKAYKSTIDTLISAGFDKQGSRIQDLISRIKELGGTYEETEEITGTFKASVTDTTSDIDDYRQTIIDLYSSLNDIMALEKEHGEGYDSNRAKISAYLDAIDELKDEGFTEQSAEIQALIQDLKDLGYNYEDSAKKATISWTDASDTISSVWSSINDAIASTNDATLEAYQEELDANYDKAEAEGATDDELTALETSNDELYDAKEEELAEEEAERTKALGLFNVAVSTAEGIMKVWAGAGGFYTKLAESAFVGAEGIAQAAAVNAASYSYKVGTFDLPSDRNADLHKGETVLTAGITQEAKDSGVAITPIGSGSSSGSSNATFIVQMDSTAVAKAVVKNINAGTAGTISKRVVK